MTNEIATVTVARFPDPSGIWFFACSTGDHISFGPLTTAWDGGSQLRDLEIHGRVADLVVAVPPTLDHDDVRSELRRVPALAVARLHIVTVTAVDLAAAFGLIVQWKGAPPDHLAGVTAPMWWRELITKRTMLPAAVEAAVGLAREVRS